MSKVVDVVIAGASVSVNVTSNHSVVEAYVRAVRSSSASTKMVVGLDIEWNSALLDRKVAVLQLCSGTKCLIIQLLHLGSIPQALRDFLADPGVTFVGVGIDADIAKLGKDYGLSCKNAVELGPLAAKVMGDPSLSGAGLVSLADRVLRLTIAKSSSVGRSDWEVVNLSSDQIVYGAVDAYVGYLIGSKLVN